MDLTGSDEEAMQPDHTSRNGFVVLPESYIAEHTEHLAIEQSRYHLEKLSCFVDKVTEACNSRWATRSQPYQAVAVLMLRWEEDDLDLDEDMSRLESIFREKRSGGATFRPSSIGDILQDKEADVLLLFDSCQAIPERIQNKRKDVVSALAASGFEHGPPAAEAVPASHEAQGKEKAAEECIESLDVLISVRLQSGCLDDLNVDSWARWLLELPPGGREADIQARVKIEGAFNSLSTLLLVRVPVSIWDLVSSNPSMSFVRGENVASDLHEKIGLSQRASSRQRYHTEIPMSEDTDKPPLAPSERNPTPGCSPTSTSFPVIRETLSTSQSRTTIPSIPQASQTAYNPTSDLGTPKGSSQEELPMTVSSTPPATQSGDGPVTGAIPPGSVFDDRGEGLELPYSIAAASSPSAPRGGSLMSGPRSPSTTFNADAPSRLTQQRNSFVMVPG
ncbi:Uu.00g070480.m01.CDS01 [Anthostomella pinea]|uniref:Uu.00g070480.m01.CDS01 n=1 Tax=Anthostomella pinea TaxID=933095 RepID=A0AAI8VUQ3_9PEZI|nr:Uu.00g070480.m01.CDS01 [Anthostomella pinea]